MYVDKSKNKPKISEVLLFLIKDFDKNKSHVKKIVSATIPSALSLDKLT